MAYVIKITNKNNDPNNASLSKLYLDSIAPSLIINPDTPYSNYESDMSLSDGSVLVPLYQRQQFVKIPVSSVLVINTDNSDEAIYYAQCKVNNSAILVDPDPFGGSSGGGTLIDKTITENGIYNAVDDDADGYSTVNVIVSGGGASNDADVRFIDYDGTIVASYSASDFANLSEMPDNPTHEGLTAQGWNWSLSYAKAHVESNGTLDIGQMYITDDQKTRLYITLQDGRSSPLLGIGINGNVVVDWGDGSDTDEMSGTDLNTTVYKRHSYSSGGDYIITLDISGSMQFNGNVYSFLLSNESDSMGARNLYLGSITKVEVGSDVYFGISAFNRCISLKTITLPNCVEFSGSSHFQECESLRSVILPTSITDVATKSFFSCSTIKNIVIPQNITEICKSAFYTCISLERVSIPFGVTTIDDSAFSSCYSIQTLRVPSSVTYIGKEAFRNCLKLTSINIPDGVTAILDNTFNGCKNLTSVEIPDSVTSIGVSVFSECRTLTDIEIPSSVASIGNYAFQNCCSISNILIPDGVTTLGKGTLQGCYSLVNIEIPSSVTNFDAATFSGCSGLSYMKFKGSTPPKTLSSDTFSNIPTDCIIYVPSGSLSTYTSASRYPSSSSYTYMEYS